MRAGPATETCLMCPVSSRDQSSWNRGDGKGVARGEVRSDAGPQGATGRTLAFALRVDASDLGDSPGAIILGSFLRRSGGHRPVRGHSHKPGQEMSGGTNPLW